MSATLDDGFVDVVATSLVANSDKSIHIAWAFDEGLPTELPYDETSVPKSTDSKGQKASKKTSHKAKIKIPPGVTQLHIVVLYDDGAGNWNWGYQQTMNV